MENVYLQNGEVRESLFSTDNFNSRRTTGNNLYDPESLLSGAEMASGLDYRNPRLWPSYEVYVEACEGFITPDEILAVAPRVKNLPKLAGFSANAEVPLLCSS